MMKIQNFSLQKPNVTSAAQDNVVPLHQMSKMQLARALNDQTERFKSLRHQWQLMTRIMVAAAMEPDALRYEQGSFVLDKGAFAKVVDGMAITIDEEETVLRIRLQQRPAPDAAPRIEIH